MTTNYYLVIHGVSGDYSDKLLTGAFKVSDFEFLTQNNGTSTYDPLSLILDSDSYTTLMTDLGDGAVISGVSLIGETTGAGGTPQITYDLNLSDAVVTALQTDGLNTGLTLDYDKIGLVTTDIGPTGKLQTPQSFGWDIANNAPSGSGTELTSSGAAAVGATAPVTYYLLIDGFNGGSVDKAHTGWFAVSNFDIDADNSSNIQTGVPGTASFRDLSVNIQGDLAGLLADSGPGTALKGVKIEGVTADGTAVYDLEVANAKIDTIADTSSPGYTIDLSYSQIGVTTKSETSAGKTTQTGTFGWDVANNEPIQTSSLPTLHVGSGANSTGAASSYYLVIHGVTGDYSDKLLTGAFKVSDFEFLTQNNGTSAFDPLSLTLNSNDYATLLTDLGDGSVISGVSLIGEATGAGGTSQITYDLNLSNVVVTNLLKDSSLSGVNLTLDYNKIGLVTNGIDANGKLQASQSFGWDITQNAATDSGTELTSAGATAVGATAPVTYYLLIDGLNGGSADKAHTGWFALSNFDIDASNTSNIQTGVPGTASFGDLSVTIQGELAGLLADSSSSTALKGLKIEGVTADGTAVYDLEVSNAKIDNISETSTSGYTIDFNYSQIGVTTKSETAPGKVTQTGSSGWDVANGQPIQVSSLPTLHVGSGANSTGAASSYYLVIHGVAGDYSDKLVAGAFKVSGFEFLTENNNGTSTFDPLSLTLNSNDYATLLTDLGEGTVISGVSLIGEATGAGGTPQITYDLNLSNVVVTDLLKDSGGVDLTLDYSKIGLVTNGIDANGKLQASQSFGWDIKQNAAADSGTELTSAGPAAVGATAPVTYYLLIDGFNGGSVDKAHTGWFAISNFDIDASNTSNIQTGFPDGGTASFGQLSVGIASDGAGLPGLLTDSGPGTALKGVKIEGVTADGTAVYDLEVTNVKIGTIVDTSNPGYTIDFNYGQIDLVTKSETAPGKATQTGAFGWDVANNEPIPPSLPTLHVGAPCYCPGTLILTDRGEVAVETLCIGDVVMTMSGAARPIKWIGRRSYAGRFAFGQKDILPVCIKAGALDENTPRRDLWISPRHAMYLEDVLIEARDLVNGVSVVQAETVDKVEYFHIELETHDVLVAEGSFSESFVDDDSRNMFHNAPEYRTLYPAHEQGSVRYYAPRLDSGYAVEKARRHIEARAGLRPVPDDNAVALRGYLDQVGSRHISGWAQNPDHPEAAVCLDIYAGGRLIGQTLANRHRDDLQQAGLGSGRHGFEFTPPAGLTFAPDAVEVRRSFDGAALSAAGAVRTNLATMKRGAVRRVA